MKKSLDSALGDCALRDGPLRCDVTRSSAVWLLLGIGPLDGAIRHLDRFCRKLGCAARVAILDHATDQNFLQLNLIILHRCVAARAPNFDDDFREVSPL